MIARTESNIRRILRKKSMTAAELWDIYRKIYGGFNRWDRNTVVLTLEGMADAGEVRREWNENREPVFTL